MLQIRQGVFETNSSSTHSITMCMKSEFDAFKNGDVYFNDGWWGSDCLVDAKDKKFITKDEAVELICTLEYFDKDKDYLLSLNEEEFEDELYEHEIYSWDVFWNKVCDWFEDYTVDFTTENGDEVVAFGYYGHS